MKITFFIQNTTKPPCIFLLQSFDQLPPPRADPAEPVQPCAFLNLKSATQSKTVLTAPTKSTATCQEPTSSNSDAEMATLSTKQTFVNSNRLERVAISPIYKTALTGAHGGPGKTCVQACACK